MNKREFNYSDDASGEPIYNSTIFLDVDIDSDQFENIMKKLKFDSDVVRGILKKKGVQTVDWVSGVNVEDKWRGRGLGSHALDECLSVSVADATILEASNQECDHWIQYLESINFETIIDKECPLMILE